MSPGTWHVRRALTAQEGVSAGKLHFPHLRGRAPANGLWRVVHRHIPQQLIFHVPPWSCLRCLGTDGTECGSRMEEHMTLENRASVSLVCKQGLLGSSRQTERPGTPAGTVIDVTEGRRGCLYFSPPPPDSLTPRPFIVLSSCVFSVLCRSSPANTMSPRWRRGSHLVLHYEMLQPRTLGHGG